MKNPSLLKLSSLIFFIVLGMNFTSAQQFLKTQGKKIIRGDEEIILRSMGLGGWMLQEGYMLQTASFAPTQHQIKAKIQALIGQAAMEEFYDAWLANHVTKNDIDSMASWGFNSIRLPMHYNLYTLPIENEPIPGQNTWIERGFVLTDSLLSWCAANHMYLILDLHAAPGGQGHDLAICDGDTSKLSLWESLENRNKTVALWKKLASRYSNEEWIGGYDLINETNWDIPGNVALRSLYVQITDSIRSVDQNHIIFIEGNWFANDFTGLTPPWDDNMVYSFHKYWNYNDVGSIQWMLNLRNNFNIPIWLGESGENSNVWFTDCIRLMESQGIGWAWWPLKKIGSVTGPLSVPKTSGYQVLLNYWSGQGPQPTAEFAKNALMEVAENLKIENCEFQKDVIDAMFRQISSDEPKPFVMHDTPGTIFSVNFDLGHHNTAYFDKTEADYHSNTNTYTAWNTGSKYRNDGVDIEVCSDPMLSNGFDVGWIEDGEWLQYSLNISDTAVYDLQTRVSSNNSNFAFHFELDGVDVCPSQNFSSTGGWQSWQTKVFSDLILDQGTNCLRFKADVGGFNFNYFTLIEKGPSNTIPARFVSAETSSDGLSIGITINKSLIPFQSGLPDGFHVLVNGLTVNIDSILIDSANPRLISLILPQQIQYGDLVKVSCEGANLTARDGTILQAFNQMTVRNNLPVRYLLPFKIQAEDYFNQKGIAVETTTDAGGGLNVGWTDPGDYLDYYIKVEETGIYPVNYRIAALQQSGKIELQIIGETTIILHEVTLPTTGGWQSWTTYSKNVNLEKGLYTIRIFIKSAGFNLNWFEFAQPVGIEENKNQKTSPLIIYPNPSSESFTLIKNDTKGAINSLCLFNNEGQLIFSLPETNHETFPLEIDLSEQIKGVYILTFNDGKTLFSNKLMHIN